MKKRLPTAKQVRFVLCEDARQEVSGKSTLIGVYPGEIVVVHKPTPPEGGNSVAALKSVCLVFFVAGGVGRFDAGIRIAAADGTVAFEQPVGVVSVEEHGTATIVGQIQPFLVKAFGVHAVTLSLDGREYLFEFTVREAISSVRPGRRVRATALTGLRENNAVLNAGPEALIARESARKLIELGGTEKRRRPAPRRRQRPSRDT